MRKDLRPQLAQPLLAGTLLGVLLGVLLIVISHPSIALGGSLRGTLTATPLLVTSELGDTLTVEHGMLTVPAFWNETAGTSDSNVQIAYYRIRSLSETPGAPVFLLAGGPGSSWIDSFTQDERFREVALYRTVADVVLFDQRGAGHSLPNLRCEGRVRLSEGGKLSEETIQSALAEQTKSCRRRWEEAGIDLRAYNTDENASDVDALRRAFGYETIQLVGGSYGSHLGLHVLRKFPDRVERAMFYGIEGPDDTWDVPSEKLAALRRIAAEIESAPAYRGRIPEGGLIGALEKVVRRVERGPITYPMPQQDGEKPIPVVVTVEAVQAAATYKAGKRSDPDVWPILILAMHEGDLSLPARAALGLRSVPAPHAMGRVMDAASGISEARRLRIESDPAARILGPINREYSCCDDLWGIRDLGPSFRAPVVSDVPTLFVHGTWDLSTPIENARRAVKGFENGHLIEVVRGNHGSLYNLYEHWPPMLELVPRYLRGESVVFPETVTMDPIEFSQLADNKATHRLWDAAKSGDVKSLHQAISDGADVNALDTRRSRSGRRPLNWAAFYGHAEAIELLLEAGADINGTNRTGFTPVHHAVENNQPDCVGLLIRLGADSGIRNKKGHLPVDTADRLGFNSIVRTLGDTSGG